MNRECYSDVGSPLELADCFLARIKLLFPEIFEPENRFFVDCSPYDFARPYGCILACTGAEIQEARHGEHHHLVDPELAIAAGYRPVCDGKRDHGGSLERFLVAYWEIAQDWPEALVYDNAADWLRAGLLMGWALHEFRDELYFDADQPEAWWEGPEDGDAAE